MDELSCWLALARAPASNRVKTELLRRFSGVEALISRAAEIASVPGIPAALAGYLRRLDRRRLAKDRAWLESSGCLVIHQGHAAYPPMLAAIDDAPVVVFVLGDPDHLSAPQVAVVGSRNPSPAGVEHAAVFSRALARLGFAVTSGLAVGIDAASHAAAMDAGGATIAVAGNGLDQIYPATNARLAKRIELQGAMVSEFPPGVPPRGTNFPRRNRLISGLSLGVVVVEAALHSGSLITARLAAEQGREVFAVPGSIDNPMSQGCHRLINEGAKLVESVADIVDELGVMLATSAAYSEPTHGQSKAPENAAEASTDDEKTILSALGHDPATVDQLVERTGLTAENVSSILLTLEIDGYVLSAPGGMYSRAKGIESNEGNRTRRSYVSGRELSRG